MIKYLTAFLILSASWAQGADVVIGTTAQGIAWEGTSPNLAARFYDKVDSYTKLLLHCDGTNTSTTIIDSSLSNRTPTLGGTGKIYTSTYKFGGASYSNNTASYMQFADSADWDVVGSAASYTIDCWLNMRTAPSSGNGMTIVSQGEDMNNGWHFFYYSVAGGGAEHSGFIMRAETGGSVFLQINTSWGVMTLNEWHHIAMVKNGTNYNTYVDGISKGSGTDSDTDSYPYDIKIGYGYNTDEGYLDGWIDEFRMSAGVARWTNNFTPPIRSYNQ